jgi:hypothetical protein
MREELLREGVLAISGNRWSDGYAWFELRPPSDGGRDTLNLRMIWASECRKGYGRSPKHQGALGIASAGRDVAFYPAMMADLPVRSTTSLPGR